MGLTEQLHRQGYAWLPHGTDRMPSDVAKSLGPLTISRDGRDYHDLRPYSCENAPPTSMSAVTGAGPQPPHTDGAFVAEPHRYVALLCLDPGEVSCPTHVWALDLDRLAADRPPLISQVIWLARGGSHPFYCTVLDVRNGRPRIRFDEICMAIPDAQPETTIAARTCLQSYAQRCDFDWEQGAMLIVDNWRCLHARGSGAHLAPSRRLRRWNIGAFNGLGR